MHVFDPILRRVTSVHDRIAMTRGLADVITVYNGPEFINKALDLWASKNSGKFRVIEPGKSSLNDYIECFNDKFRD